MAEPEASNESSEDKSKRDQDILEVARERFRLAEELWHDVYDKGREDLRFISGDQWDWADKVARKEDGRPCLTVNKLPQYTRQIVNDQRQSKPSIKVSPVDDNADIETAKIHQGLIRNIEYSSKADMAYGRAFEGAVENGFGFYRVRTDYCSPESFDQDIIIDSIQDPFLVYLDPFFKKPDGSDSNWGFIQCRYNKDDYNAEFGESALGKEKDWTTFSSDKYGSWISEKEVRVCEYYSKEFKKTTLAKLSNGDVIDKAGFAEGVIDQQGQPITIVAEKQANIPIVYHRKINAVEILEETIVPGEFIPILPVFGKIIILDGKRIIESAVRHALDPQRMHNYWVTCETETIALAPKAPFIAAEGTISKEYMPQWLSANKKNHAVLFYKSTDSKGTPVAPPQRNVFEAPVQAITNARMQSGEDLKSTTGMFDAGIGAQGNETSGIAIQRRASQTQTTNYHFIDNLNQSIRHCGRILLDWIPHVYDTPRAARIIGEEGQEEMVMLNQIFEHKGEAKHYDTSAGKYDAVVESGPSYATKRQEAASSMLELSKAFPQLVGVAGDLIVKNMDIPGASEISERFKKSLPPGLAEDDKQKKPIPPEVQQQLQQMDQMVHALTQKLNEANDAIKTKTVEIESRERIEMLKIERDYKLEVMKQQGAAANLLFAEEIKQINQRLQLLGIGDPIDENEMNGEQPQGGQPTQQPNQNLNGNPQGMPAQIQPTDGQHQANYMGEQ